jgi:uncharacterized protein YukE
MEYIAIYNSGNEGDSTNQCLWISIIQYLNFVLGYNLDFKRIRQIAKNRELFQINGTQEMFDFEKHMEALRNVLSHFNLQIRIYFANMTEEGNSFIDIRSQDIGSPKSGNIVHIVSYGAHFELISQIGDEVLYQGALSQLEKINGSSPKASIAIGKKESETERLTREEIGDDVLYHGAIEHSITLSSLSPKASIAIGKKESKERLTREYLDELAQLELLQSKLSAESDELKKNIQDTEQEIISTKSMLKSIKTDFDKQDYSQFNEEMQTTMVENYQINMVKINESLEELQLIYEDLKKEFDSIKSNVNETKVRIAKVTRLIEQSVY